MIPVTRAFLPPLAEYEAQLARIWKTGLITNRGLLVKELEDKLRSYLGVEHLVVTTNGTIPLQIAIKTLQLRDEVITTPFSYVATTSSLVWENCKPVFVDIHPEYLTIDETKIEEAITPACTGILATHVFGNPCNVDAIGRVAQEHNLKVIYDAAHCFGVEYQGQSIFNYGDVSTCSFHATKLFHTGEGGAMICKDEELYGKLFYGHNFGHDGPIRFHGLGINGKMSELQAAMGLAVLPYMSEIISCRKVVTKYYDEAFEGLALQVLKVRPETRWNHSYYPIVLEDESKLLEIEKALCSQQIYPRRYFYPALNTLPYVQWLDTISVATSIAERVLCLPLFDGLLVEDQFKVIDIIRKLI